MKDVFGPHTFREYAWDLPCIARLHTGLAQPGTTFERRVAFAGKGIGGFDVESRDLAGDGDIYQAIAMVGLIARNQDKGWKDPVPLRQVLDALPDTTPTRPRLRLLMGGTP
jgi:hypothetical protein